MNPDQLVPYCLQYMSRYETGDTAGKGLMGRLNPMHL